MKLKTLFFPLPTEHISISCPACGKLNNSQYTFNWDKGKVACDLCGAVIDEFAT